MANRKFIPSKDQIEIYKTCLAFDMKEDLIRLKIKGTNGKPISTKTFHSAFDKYKHSAKTELLEECFNVFRKGLHKKDDWHANKEAASKIMQLMSKGVLNPKFNLDKNKSAEENIKEVMDALNERKITQYEADVMVKGCEALIRARQADTKLDIDKETANQGNITIMIDNHTNDVLQGSLIEEKESES